MTAESTNTSNGNHGLPLIGWREAVFFPELGIGPIRAKIDSGANTSALHVSDVERIDGDRVSFHIALDRHGRRLSDRLEAPIVRTSTVRSSTGHAQERFVVPLKLAVGENEFEVEVSLVCRKGMLCRMLLGRRALADRFLVDAASMYLVSTRPRKRPRRKKSAKGD
ncbi:MAG: RimK/LysX family protein [bacterium]|nr:RimK/LysX family protein [bacterium]